MAVPGSIFAAPGANVGPQQGSVGRAESAGPFAIGLARLGFTIPSGAGLMPSYAAVGNAGMGSEVNTGLMDEFQRAVATKAGGLSSDSDLDVNTFV